jgi:hypothetical protein
MTILLMSILTTAVTSAPPITDHRPALEQALAEFDEGQKLFAVQPDFARQHFRSAAQKLESVAVAGIANGKLEFNLGNCYLQAGDLGRAILHYRRAQRIIPRDPLLADNFALARSRCLTQIPMGRGDSVLRSVFFWHYQTSELARTMTCLFSYVGVFMFLQCWTITMRRFFWVPAVVCGVIALASGASIGAELWSLRTAPPAVVTAMDVVVYKGPGASYQKQFEQPLQPGVECTLREKRGPWWNIELADGKSGWVESTVVETVAAE